MKFILLIKLKDFNSLDKLNDTVAIILCHGYSTASSIASSVNKMLGVNVFDAIDMQLDLSIEKTVEQLNNYLSSKTNYKDLILLVDMGSLEDIYKFTNKINSSMIIVNNVNTKTALIIGSAIKNEEDVYSIIKSLNETEPYQYKYIDEDIKKEVILSVCATGLGSANKIKNLFEDSLPEAIPINIITYDYQKLVNNGLNDPVFDKYDVKFIIGTMNPCIENIPFIAVEDLLLNVDAFILDELVSKYFDEEKMSLFKNNIMKNFTLNNIVNYLTILNAEKVIEDVEIVINSIENRLGKFEAGIKMGLFVHLACMIERLILRNEFVIDNRDNITADERFIEIVKEAFSVVKNRYSVDIPDPEIIYMYKYIYNQA